ncbi:MAG TPA: diaminopimelate decarboxylase [Solirubrobacteraceae bacterium]|nr:diaminopimelate decarboxylase [Solirubrobacteraceae bacterium]
MYPEDSSVEGGVLSVGGCDARELAREFGTPAYVVAESDLRARARDVVAALAAAHDGPGEVVFASKAFPCTAVLRVFAEEGLGCDVASGGELHLALRAGFAPERLYLHGNAKSDAELEFALEAGVGTVVLDNEHDADRLAALGGGPRVLLRVVPGVDADTHEYILTGKAGSKFGMPPDAARALAERFDVAGLHMHIGSQIRSLDPYRRAVAALARVGDFEVYDLGGGLGVRYLEGDAAPSPQEWVRQVVGAAHAELGAEKSLVLEPGRSLVANAGVTLYRVETVKPGVGDERIVAVDGGMSDNLRPMLYGAAYEAAVADRMGAGGDVCTVVGKHCESGDVLVRDARLPDPRPGDVLVTPVTGAYGHAMANNYNGVPRPPVIFCSGGDARVVVRRETYEDLGGRDV